MIKAIIFDLDGTLLNTLDDLADSCNETLKQLNFPLHSIEDIKGFVGNGITRLMELAIPCGKNNPEFEKSVFLMKQNYAKNRQNKTKPYDEILDLFNNLKEKNIKLGIVSNKPDEQVKELAKTFFNDFIDSKTAIGDKEGRKLKPAPDSIYEVMKIFNVQKDETLYVGDSDVDIATAKNANVKCISVTWGFREKDFLLLYGAKNLIDKPSQILNYL